MCQDFLSFKLINGCNSQTTTIVLHRTSSNPTITETRQIDVKVNLGEFEVLSFGKKN